MVKITSKWQKTSKLVGVKSPRIPKILIMSPTMLYVHNFHIQALIEEFSTKKLWPLKGPFQCHITCLNKKSFGFIFEFKWSGVKFQVWFLFILLTINFFLIILNDICEPTFHIYVSKPFQWYIGGPILLCTFLFKKYKTP